MKLILKNSKLVFKKGASWTNVLSINTEDKDSTYQDVSIPSGSTIKIVLTRLDARNAGFTTYLKKSDSTIVTLEGVFAKGTAIGTEYKLTVDYDVIAAKIRTTVDTATSFSKGIDIYVME